jgi:acetoacetyl-CoA synthetase
MFSSGTTGKPKSIVHSAGGTLIQHIKEHRLHTNLRRDDVIFYFTTCGWMMWNWLVTSLSTGSTIVLYDGNPFSPNDTTLLDISDKLGITIFGTSAKYISTLRSKEIIPKSISDFSTLRLILSTGSPLSSDNFDFVYNHWKKDVQLSSISGGTDIISCFALGNPLLPVYRGELQSRGLGMAVDSYDNNGNSIRNAKGELVCKLAFPSMPIYFWNDKKGEKYKSAYFSDFPDIWSHGDYIEINDHDGILIYGRSDATLNPGGVRIGTAEIYRVIDQLEDIDDSLVIGQPWGDDERIILFIKLNENVLMDESLKNNIKNNIRQKCTPRHIPAKIIPIEDIPYTLNGKKVEIAIKNIIQNLPIKNKDSLSNPSSLEFYKNLDELKY